MFGPDEVALGTVVDRDPRCQLAHRVDVELAERLGPSVTGQCVGGVDALVQRRVVDVREVVVVRRVDRPPIQKDVEEVVRVGVVRIPTREHDVEVGALVTGGDVDREAGELLERDVAAHLLQVVGDDALLGDVRRRRSAPEVDVSARRAPEELLGRRRVSTLLRIQLRTPVTTGECGRQDLGGALTRQEAACAEHCRAVDCVVRSTPCRNGGECRPRRVEREVVGLLERVHEEPRLVDAVLLGELRSCRRAVEPRRVSGVGAVRNLEIRLLDAVFIVNTIVLERCGRVPL